MRVETVGEGLLRLLHAEGADPTDALVRASVERGWSLYHLSAEHASLEDVFVQLTQQDSPVQEVAA
jgi:ABC-2 type transport system ATP-binding protein